MRINHFNYQQAWQKSFTDRRYRVGLHLVFWLVYFAIFKIAAFVMVSSLVKDHHFMDIYSIVNIVIGDPVLCITFYLTIRTAYRSLVYRKKYLIGVIYMLLCIGIYVNLLYFSNEWAVGVVKWMGYPIRSVPATLTAFAGKSYGEFMSNSLIVIQTIFTYFLYMCIPVCCKFFRDQWRLQKRQAALEKQNIQLEMDFLKAQVHPHFLFNTLNNIYSLVTHHENRKSAEMIAGLSSLLRYALYDGKSEFIPLEKEIGMLQDFIALEEIRSDDMRLETAFPTAYAMVKIPPFLLLPLVENAFKHGVNSQLKQSCVKIDLQINKKELLLQVQNTFDPEYRKRSAGGLGIANLKKRLDYYYGDHYSFETGEKDHVFVASLKLPLPCPISAV